MKETTPARSPWKRRAIRLGIAGAAFLLVAPVAAHWMSRPVRFHQFEIARLESRYLELAPTDLGRTIRSVYASGWDRLLGRRERREPAFDDASGVFRYVFSWVPSYAVVYPTERFYYFQTRIQGKEVWGNLRLADIAKGRLMFSYFATPISDGRVRTIELTERDGLKVDPGSEDACDVTLNGRTVRFVIADLGTQTPKALRMLPEEETAGHVHDESGLRFFLLYNRETRAFYYVLDEEGGAPERFQELEGGLLFAQRSEFVFLEDRDFGRKLLLGVSFKNIEANNYFDGPGDQVPIGLDLRDRIYAAYPSARFGEGIDAHGVMLGQPHWCRYVIGPYHPYGSLADVVSRVRLVDPALPKGPYWTQLTREWWWTPSFVESTRQRLVAEGKPVDMPPLAFHAEGSR